jgi:hypothetical protein
MSYRTLYLDESGQKNREPPFAPGDDTCFVCVGVSLTPEQDIRAREGVISILEKRFERQMGRPEELHYGDIINSRDHYADWGPDEKKALADDVFKLIQAIRPELYGTVIQLEWHYKKYKTPYPRVELALRSTVDRFHMDIERQDDHAMVFIDEDSARSDKALRAMIHRARKIGIKLWGREWTPSNDSRLERVLNSVIPYPSHLAPGIQLADFVAYATNAKYSRGKTRRFDELADLWKKHPFGQEPSLVPPREPAKHWRERYG